MGEQRREGSKAGKGVQESSRETDRQETKREGEDRVCRHAGTYMCVYYILHVIYTHTHVGISVCVYIHIGTRVCM